MAKKKKESIILENVELKPQVIGYTYQKKNNIGRVLFIFVIFALVIFYINDISIFINELLGRKTPTSINNNQELNKEEEKDNLPENEIVYNEFSNALEIKESELTLNNFSFANNILTFDVINNTNKTINLSKKKIFLETYSNDKTLLERVKLDLGEFTSNKKMNYSFNLNNEFFYIVIEEKTVEDYLPVNLTQNENGLAFITCKNEMNEYIYTFNKNELTEIKHTVTNNNIQSEDYSRNYNLHRNKISSYKNIEGVSSTFNGDATGYTATIIIDLSKTDLSKLNDKYYYGYKTLPKEVNFEMQAYGFTCN